jgi:aconitate decarboxylase
VQANIGSMTKALHCGQAAASGLEAARMAAAGFTADADALGDPRGYARAFFGDGFVADELTRLHAALQIVAPGPAYKLYPSQYGTHFVITAALAARASIPAGSRIARVTIVAPPMPYVDRPAPATGLAGKFSFQYTAAAALLDGSVTVASFADARRFAPDMVALLPLITVVADPSRQGRFDAMAVDVAVEHDGGTAVGTCDGPPGIWGRPVTAERLAAKARDCLAAVLPAALAADVVDTAAGFDALDAAGLVRLLAILAGASPYGPAA